MDGSTMNEEFFLKGLDGKALCTDGDQIQIGLNNRAWVRKEASERADIDTTHRITGTYEVNGYEGNRNDWHYVEIKVHDAANGVYKWKNRAGVQWTLTRKQGSADTFMVGRDCPYYDRANYKEAKLILNDDGTVR